MPMDVRVPGSPAEVTPAWLARCLREAGLLDDAEISAIDVKIIGEDRGFTGVVAKLTPHYSQSVQGAPSSLIAKFPLADRAGNTSYRDHLATNPGLARGHAERGAREVHFYAMARQTFSQIPDFYYGHADAETGEVVLLIEDLVGATPGDALASCSQAEASSVLSGLGELHARWWGGAELSAMHWLGDWASAISGRVERFEQQAGLVHERYRERLAPGTMDLIGQLREYLKPILEDLATAPIALVHGDMHLDNVMFMPAPGGSAAYIIDWQGVARGPALLDVAGFVAESLGVAERRGWEIELLREYHAGLRRAGVGGYVFERLYDDYLRALIVRFTGVVGWLARVEIDDLEGRERALVEAHLDPAPVFTAATDHDILRRLGYV